MDNSLQRSDGASRTAAPGTPSNTGLTTREQIGLAVLAADRARRGAFARVRRARFMSWRYRSPEAEELLIAPPDLRAQDLSFLGEIDAGGFGLAGSVVTLGGRSPFEVTPPDPEWARELHGFGWLRHLDAVRSPAVEEMARKWVREWIAGRSPSRACGWAPDVVGRRIVSWLTYAGLLLDDAEHKPYTAIMRSLAEQITYLSASWRNAPDGYPRLVALTALVYADLCIAGRDRQLAQSERRLAAELQRQILPDGSHISRNPNILVELLFDLLPLRQCFGARGRKPQAALLAAITRMAPMLRMLRLGDGMLARFNGAGSAEHDALATVLAYDDGGPARTAEAAPSGYVRLERGATAVVVDAGAPPPLELAGSACAGCLSFELSIGSEVLLVNAGTPATPDGRSRALARATASHNTLTLSDQSSSKLIRNARLERQIGAAPIRQPENVTCRVREEGGVVVFEGSHDGYADRFGLIHTRMLVLDASGRTLQGIDKLDAAKGVLRFAWDLPFAVHFHLPPAAEARAGQSPDVAELALESGEHWRISVAGAAISIEESTYFADISGPRPTQQVVLRAVCYGAAEVCWRLERIREGQPADYATRRRLWASRPLSERLAETSDGFDTPQDTPEEPA
ncbi:MAG: heparinase [Hyphomicrobiaceae bacterium]|nr:MAG: heparinase [Hyphomicrobiaceae bacterium]